MKTVNEFYKESEYSKIDFGSNPKLFSEKELLDFANKYVEAVNVIPCCKSDSELLADEIERPKFPENRIINNIKPFAIKKKG